jgi:hypothetical protein
MLKASFLARQKPKVFKELQEKNQTGLHAATIVVYATFCG